MPPASPLRRLAAALAVGAAIGLPAAFAQSPATSPAAPSAASPPAAASPAPAQTPAQPQPQAQDKPADPFGEELTLASKTVVSLKGTANWDTAFETLVAAFKKVYAALDKQGVTPAGAAMTIYTATDDTGFSFEAQVPVGEAPKNLPKEITVGKSPEGKALKFVHRGSYDSMDNTYEAITNHLDEKKLEALDMFIEEYVTDILKTSEDKLVINVFVPLK